MPPSPAVRHAALTDVGVKRSHNQDACTAQPAADPAHYLRHGHVFVVADGMGGHAVGEKASAKAVRDIPLTYLKHVEQDGPAAAIRRAFKEANAAIYGIGQNNPEFKGLGTTATALFLRPDGAWFGHVGDSRAYRVRGGRVQQLTFDHSWVWEVARRQGVDPDDLGDFKRNVIIRSLGPDADVEVDLEGPHPVEPGDTFLLCSDGLSNMVAADEIGAVVSTFPPDEACRFLVELANARGGPDNITCLIAQVPGGTTETAAVARPSPAARLAAAVRRWNRKVPWPLSAMGGSVLLGGLAVLLKLADLPGSVPLFVAAGGLLVGGAVGLVLQARKKGADDATGDDGDGGTVLNLHRDYTFDVGPALVERLAAVETKIRHEMNGQDLGVDWAAHARHLADAEESCRKAAWAEAFKARCLAVQCVAVPYNKHRHKAESFKPNWTTKPAG